MMAKQACLHCSKEFTPVRSTAKFCSTQCRVKYHRAKKRNTVDMLELASDAIRAMARAAKQPETSYEAVDMLLTLRDRLDKLIPVNSGSVWLCRKCEHTATIEFPGVGDCECESPDWVLQEMLI